MPAKNISLDFHSFNEATSDSDRPKPISFLTKEPFSVLDLAESIGGNPAAIMRHLGLLIEANLVKAADQDGVTFYRFNSKNLELMARWPLSQPQNEIDLSSFDLSEDHQVFNHNYTRSDGSLKMISTQSKKIIVILEYTSRGVEFDAYYSKKEVNALVTDSTTLRGYLVDYGYLGGERNGTRYWRFDNRQSTAGIHK